MTDHTFDENLISDIHKDAYGYRPTSNFWQQWKSADDDGKQAIWDEVCEISDASIERERIEQKNREADFNNRILIIRDAMNNSREDAIRILICAEGLEEQFKFYGYDYIEYEFGLGYNFIKNSLA